MLKLVRILLIIIGGLLIALNILVLAVQFSHFYKMISEMNDTAEKLGGIIGSVLLAIIGGILLLVAKRINKKLKHKKAQEELQDFLA